MTAHDSSDDADPHFTAPDAAQRNRQTRIDRPHGPPSPHLLPSLAVIRELLDVLEDEEVDYAAFCAQVQEHAAIASRILGLANSAVSGSRRAIGLQHAVALIGLGRVRRILESLQGRVEAEDARMMAES